MTKKELLSLTEATQYLQKGTGEKLVNHDILRYALQGAITLFINFLEDIRVTDLTDVPLLRREIEAKLPADEDGDFGLFPKDIAIEKSMEDLQKRAASSAKHEAILDRQVDLWEAAESTSTEYTGGTFELLMTRSAELFIKKLCGDILNPTERSSSESIYLMRDKRLYCLTADLSSEITVFPAANFEFLVSRTDIDKICVVETLGDEPSDENAEDKFESRSKSSESAWKNRAFEIAVQKGYPSARLKQVPLATDIAQILKDEGFLAEKGDKPVLAETVRRHVLTELNKAAEKEN